MRDSLRKYLAAATLLVLSIIAACGEDVMPPPPTGSIVGQVSIEGMGIDGVSVSLSNGASTATAGGGNYRFDNVEQGSYTVTISGFPADASFDQTSAPASIGDTGGTVTVDFRGTYIRTAAIMGTVTAANGYNDHDYTFSITRTAPVGNSTTNITADGTTVTWGDGTIVAETVDNANSSADIVVELSPLQSLAVTVGGDAVSCTTTGTTTVTHTCSVTGLVAGGQTSVLVTITSEDGVAAQMRINLQRAAS